MCRYCTMKGLPAPDKHKPQGRFPTLNRAVPAQTQGLKAHSPQCLPQDSQAAAADEGFLGSMTTLTRVKVVAK